MKSNPRTSTRRQFLKHSVAAASLAVAPSLLTPRPAPAAAKHPKDDRPRVGCVGLGIIWNFKLQRARDILPYLNIVALCDVDQKHLAAAREKVGGNVPGYKDYRKLLDRKDVDCVQICVPDHWHAKIAVEAMRAGKDVYCEKPMTLTIDEGKLVCATLKKTGRVFQVGTQQRTEFEQRFLKAVALVRDGRLGKIRRVTCGLGAQLPGGPFKKTAAPPELDWDMWLGQAPLVDYIPERCHDNFRWWMEYSGGKITDWGAHHVDIAQWALGYEHDGPKTVEPLSFKFPVPLHDGYPTRDDAFNTPQEFEVKCTFRGGEELIITHAGRNGILFEGEKGRIFVNRETLSGKPVDELAERPLSAELLKKLYKGKEPYDHIGNFAECVKDRSEPASDVFTHHRALTTCHLANIALRLGRKIHWNAEHEQIIGDDEASRFQQREPRKGYEITL